MFKRLLPCVAEGLSPGHSRLINGGPVSLLGLRGFTPVPYDIIPSNLEVNLADEIKYL